VPTVAPDVIVRPLGGKDRSLADQVGLFQLVLVVLDPYTYESSWVLETAGRILTNFMGADCRAAFMVTAGEKETREFLGPWSERLMVFCDPDRVFVKAADIHELPAFVHIEHDCTIAGKAEGWDPETWRPIADNIGRIMSWSTPQFPIAGDPVPFAGTPALP